MSIWPEISIHVVEGGVDEAVAHINRYGTNHSECIVASSEEAITVFQQGLMLLLYMPMLQLALPMVGNSALVRK